MTRQERLEYNRNYYKNNKEYFVMKGKRWAAANKDKVKKQKARWYQENKKRCGEVKEAWKKRNPEKVAAQHKRRRERRAHHKELIEKRGIPTKYYRDKVKNAFMDACRDSFGDPIGNSALRFLQVKARDRCLLLCEQFKDTLSFWPSLYPRERESIIEAVDNKRKRLLKLLGDNNEEKKT